MPLFLLSVPTGELEKNKGTQFDPEVADAFIELIKEGKVPL